MTAPGLTEAEKDALVAQGVIIFDGDPRFLDALTRHVGGGKSQDAIEAILAARRS